jgi:glycosyltransferase involved in cell wall biosynthesis
MSERVSILHVIYSPQRRGAEVFASQLAKSLESDGFHNAVCSLYEAGSGNGLSGELIRFSPIAAKRQGLPARLGLQPAILVKLTSILRELNPDIVLAHGSDTFKYVAMARLFHSRAITVYRNIDLASFWARSAWKAACNRMLLKSFDAVVSVSQATREDFLKHYRLSPERIVTIPNAVEVEPYRDIDPCAKRQEVRHTLGLQDDDIILVAVGSLCQQKNQGPLVSLVAELCRHSRPSHLLLIGDGVLRGELEQQARQLQVDSYVHFLGVRTDVPQLLAASDIFLLPSRSEGMPAVLIEAGLAGLPSVVYDVGGTKEVIEHGRTGVLVASQDYAEFKRGVLRLIENPQERKVLGALARPRCLSRFAIQSVAEEYAALFLRLLRHRGKLGNG